MAKKDAIQHLADLVGIAASQLGKCESPRGSNRGPAIAQFFAADNYNPGRGADEGYPWCASFVCWCLQQWLSAGASERFAFTAPRTASAFGLIDWAMTQPAVQLITGDELRTGRYRPAPGDVVVWDFSHTSIVNKPAPRGMCSTIDGNTNAAGGREGYEVACKTRRVDTIRALLRFIPTALGVPRLPVIS